MRRVLAVLLAAAPAAAAAFEAVDTLPYPSLGTFPAYPPEGERPLRLYAQAGVMRDDNVLRRPDAQSETITRIGVGGSYDARVVGRQMLHLEATGDAVHYDRFGDLDHFAYGLLGEWRWELGSPLSGTLGYGRRRFQVDLAERSAPVEDLITENRLYGTAAYRITPDWRVRGGLAAVEADRPDTFIGETSSSSVTAGVDYVTPLGNTLGLEVRRTSGDAPVDILVDPAGAFRDNEYDEDEVSAVAAYNVGPKLRLGARVGRTERTYTQLPEFDFEGTTYRFDASWYPGNKTLLALEVYKVPRSVIEIDATHVIARGVAFGPSWAPTSKLVFSARIVREEREFPGNPAAVGLVDIREENVRALRLAAGWEATRHFHFGVGWDSGKRTSNLAGREYEFDAFMVNGRYVF